MDKLCETCGSSFSVRAYRATTARFCSRKCKGVGLGAPQFKAMTTKPWNRGNTFRAGKRPTNAYSPGNVPWNKDLKGIHLSPDSEFTAGHAHPSDPVGTVRIRMHRGVPRAWVKVAMPRTWRMRAVVVYEMYHGSNTPAGMVVHHIDRDTLNDVMDNLQLLTKAEHINVHRDELSAVKALRRMPVATEQPDT